MQNVSDIVQRKHFQIWVQMKGVEKINEKLAISRKRLENRNCKVTINH